MKAGYVRVSTIDQKKVVLLLKVQRVPMMLGWAKTPILT